MMRRQRPKSDEDADVAEDSANTNVDGSDDARNDANASPDNDADTNATTTTIESAKCQTAEQAVNEL